MIHMKTIMLEVKNKEIDVWVDIINKEYGELNGYRS